MRKAGPQRDAPVLRAAVTPNAIFEYLEIFHNRQRRHSALGMLTPVEFEAPHQPITAA
jgi:transposase InsO family protein